MDFQNQLHIVSDQDMGRIGIVGQIGNLYITVFRGTLMTGFAFATPPDWGFNEQFKATMMNQSTDAVVNAYFQTEKMALSWIEMAFPQEVPLYNNLSTYIYDDDQYSLASPSFQHYLGLFEYQPLATEYPDFNPDLLLALYAESEEVDQIRLTNEQISLIASVMAECVEEFIEMPDLIYGYTGGDSESGQHHLENVLRLAGRIDNSKQLLSVAWLVEEAKETKFSGHAAKFVQKTLDECAEELVGITELLDGYGAGEGKTGQHHLRRFTEIDGKIHRCLPFVSEAAKV